MTRKEKQAATEARIEKESLELAENIFKWASDYQKKGEKDPFGKATHLATIKLQKDTKANPHETHIYIRIASATDFLASEVLKKLIKEGSIKTKPITEGA